jgi:hypothetical protein
MLRFHNMLPALAFVAATGTAFSAYAEPCSAQIARVERQVGAAGTNSEIGPFSPQTVGAQLGHQPTPQTVRDAEMTANAAAQAALERVKKANSADNAAACRQALSALKERYGLE